MSMMPIQHYESLFIVFGEEPGVGKKKIRRQINWPVPDVIVGLGKTLYCNTISGHWTELKAFCFNANLLINMSSYMYI